MNDMGMIMITEDELDEMFRDKELPSDLVSGRNIKTGCYGLFLVALDSKSLNIDDEILLRGCINIIEEIDNDTMFYSMAIHYPPDNIEYDDIINIAKSVMFVYDTGGTTTAQDMPEDKIELINETLMGILGMNSRIIEITEELDEELDNEQD